MDGFIGEIRAFCYTFVPYGWILCDGRQLPVAQYSALYAVINNMYGGNNVMFNVPDLQGRIAIGTGPATSETSARACGNKVGTVNVTLSGSQLPAHGHDVKIIDAQSNATDPAGAYWARGMSGGRPAPTKTYLPTANVPMASQMIQPAGAPAPTGHENRQPYLVTCMCICWEGLFPVRQ